MHHHSIEEMDSFGNYEDAAALPPLDRFLGENDDLYGDAGQSPPSAWTDPTPSSPTNVTTDPLGSTPLFWAVNAIAVLAILVVVLCVCHQRGDGWINGWAAARSPGGNLSDSSYARGVIRRMQEEEERKKETPERRKERLMRRFEERGVRLVVTANDFVGKPRCASATVGVENAGADIAPTIVDVENGAPTATKAESKTIDADEGDDLETGKDTSAKHDDAAENGMDADAGTGEGENFQNEEDTPRNDGIPLGEADDTASMGEKSGVDSLDSATAPPAICLPANSTQSSRTVPNCCAVCLCPYEIDDALIHSSNPNCPHAFHEECIVEWLVKMQTGTPCPCCRQEFIDLPDNQEARGKTLDDESSSSRTVRSFDLDLVSWV